MASYGKLGKVVKDAKCPKCKVNYKLTEKKHYLTHKREPVLLLCGHAVCEACVASSAHTCAVCQQVTVFEKKQILPKHLYILGRMVSNRNEDLKMNLQPPWMRSLPKGINKELCQECCKVKATLLCKMCTSQLCQNCFKKIHSPRTMKAHQAVPLQEDGPGQVLRCPEHPGDACGLLCNTCSTADQEKFICTRCHVLGSHQQHEVTELRYLNSLHLPGVEQALSEMEGVVEVLQAGKERCHAQVARVAEEHQAAVQKIFALTHCLHGLLQLQEDIVTQQLQQTADALYQDISYHDMELEQEIGQRLELAKKTRTVLQETGEGYHVKRLLDDLRRLGPDSPASVIKGEKNEDSCRLDILGKLVEEGLSAGDFGFDIEKIIQRFGFDIEKIIQRFSLLSASQLPSAEDQEVLKSAVCQTQEEAINEGKLTPGHLQLLDSKFQEFQEDPPLALSGGKIDTAYSMKLQDDADDSYNSSAKLEGNKLFYSEVKGKMKPNPLLVPKTLSMTEAPSLCLETQKEADCLSPPENVASCHSTLLNNVCFRSSESPCQLLETMVNTVIQENDSFNILSETPVAEFFEDKSNQCTPDVIPSWRTWEDRGARPKMTPQLGEPTQSSFMSQLVPGSLDSKSVSVSSLCSSGSGRGSFQMTSKATTCFIEEEVEVTHIQSPSSFFVHLKSNIPKRTTLSRKLNWRARKSDPPQLPLVEGTLCLGQFTKDDKWYRVVVRKVIPGRETVWVNYVDYGNSEELLVSRLRSCPPEHRLEVQPPLALACSLWEVVPAKGDTWNTEATLLFAKLVKGVSLQLILVAYDTGRNSTKCQVELRRPWKTVGVTNDHPISIREILIFLEYAVYVNETPSDFGDKDCKASFKRRFFLPEIPHKVETDVLLSCVASPHSFSLQLVSMASHLSHLMTDLEKYYSNPRINECLEWCIYSPKLGMPCVAKFNGDGKWRRAQVKALPGRQMVDVEYVDFGNKERLWYHQIYKMTDDFLVLPIQAISCTLCDVVPVGELWQEEDASHMIEICAGQTLKAVFFPQEKEVCDVKLHVLTGDSAFDVGKLLMELGRAAPVDPFPNMKNGAYQMLQETGLGKTGVQHQPPQEQELLKNKYVGKESLEVAHLEILEPFCHLHVRLDRHESCYHLFQAQLAEAVESIVQKAVVGKDCVVQLRPTCLARARVLSVAEDHAQVLLVDCGGIERVSTANIFAVPEKFKGLEYLSHVVNLAGVVPPAGLRSWPGITVDHLKQEFSSFKNFYILPKGCPFWDEQLQMKVLPVELGRVQEVAGGPMKANTLIQISVNDLLIDRGLALPARSTNRTVKKLVDEDNQEMPPCATKCSQIEEKHSQCVLQETVDEAASMLCVSECSGSVGGAAVDLPNQVHGWTLPLPPTCTSFIATPSYVNHDGYIFLQPKSNSATVNLICDSQTLQFNGSSPTDRDLCWAPGDPVVAQYHLDKKWYRATIDNLEENGDVQVTFVDYGNPETVKVQEIRTYLINTEIPIQCYKAALVNIAPASEDGLWDRKLLDFIHQSIVEKECRVSVVEEPRPGEALKVNLELVGVGLDVVSFLVDKMKVCKRISPVRETREELNSSDVIIESEESQDSIKYFPGFAPPLLLPMAEKFCIQVTAIEDPAHVYVSPVINAEQPSSYDKLWLTQYNNLDKFITYINKDTTCLPQVHDPKIGEVYLARFITGVWLRVQVVTLDSTKAIVLYLDFGYLEGIPIETIRECPVEGKKIPRGATRVQLSQVQPPEGPEGGWEEEAMKAMIACLMGPKKQCFLASVVEPGNPTEVELFKMDSRDPASLAYAEAVDKGFIVLKTKK